MMRECAAKGAADFLRDYVAKSTGATGPIQVES